MLNAITVTKNGKGDKNRTSFNITGKTKRSANLELKSLHQTHIKEPEAVAIWGHFTSNNRRLGVFLFVLVESHFMCA